MKRKTRQMAGMGLTLAAMFATAGTVVAKENAYDFRKRLEIVHEEGLRDVALRPAADEIELKNGLSIVVPAGDRGLVFRAAQDLQDYLTVSMGVAAIVLEKGAENGTVAQMEIALADNLPPRTATFDTTEAGVRIVASDERAAQQALFHLEDLMNLRRAPFLKKGQERRRQLFSPRMTHSGWSIDVFPDAHLRQIAHAGMDAIVIFIKDIDHTAGAEHQDVNDVIRRAKRQGQHTYLYSYLNPFSHPADP